MVRTEANGAVDPHDAAGGRDQREGRECYDSTHKRCARENHHALTAGERSRLVDLRGMAGTRILEVTLLELPAGREIAKYNATPSLQPRLSW